MIEIRACSGLQELEACVQLQIETWGYDTSEIFPRKAFLLAQKIGGQVIGAFDREPEQTAARALESLAGFVLSLPGIKSEEKNSTAQPLPYLHSHMLAVRPQYRNQGIGAQLKLEQRREALGRGIRRIEWTFDPLEIKNAFLNIHKLGATASRYEANFYGVSSSRLQGGLPTDRLVAEWQLELPRVAAILEGRPAQAVEIQERILVPAQIGAWKATTEDRERALTVQSENRRKFQEAFSAGMSVVDFHLDADGNGVFELGFLARSEANCKSQGVKNR